MEQVQKSMLFAFSTGTTLTALSLALALFTTTSATADHVVEVNAGRDHNVQTTLRIPDTYTVTGAQVIQTLYQIADLHVDIQVDGVAFSKDLDTEQIDVSSISTIKSYVPTYLRAADGSVQKIVFTSR